MIDGSSNQNFAQRLDCETDMETSTESSDRQSWKWIGITFPWLHLRNCSKTCISSDNFSESTYFEGFENLQNVTDRDLKTFVRRLQGFIRIHLLNHDCSGFPSVVSGAPWYGLPRTAAASGCHWEKNLCHPSESKFGFLPHQLKKKSIQCHGSTVQ